ncbi:MAG: Zn-ribbon domain-containing OB-fold protein [Actinobacteria bacterium]|nr:Zn-ribbon domain-containing OB-fold protein [Actinomycetota bacterium]
MSGAVPEPTPDTLPFWEAAGRGVLSIQRCIDCAAHFFYPRDHCPTCLGDRVEWTEVSGRATLHTYLICHDPAPGFENDVPYVIAIVELEEGPRMMSNIVGVEPDPELLPLDLPLEVVFEERNSVVLPFFRPAGPA